MQNLEIQYSSQKSFYGKAKILEDGSLMSYSTEVITKKPIKNDGWADLYILNGWYSMTTGKHIKEFMLQMIGKAIGKADIMKHDAVYHNAQTGEVEFITNVAEWLEQNKKEI